MQKLRSIILEITSVNEVTKIGQILKKNIKYFDMEYFLLGIGSPSSLTRTSIIIEDNFPKKWRDYYDLNCLAKIDPIVSYCLNNHSPITWAELQENSCSSAELGLFKKAKEHGLIAGFSIPIHSSGNQFGMLSMASASDKGADELFATQMKAQTVIPAIQDAYNRLTRPLSTIKPNLTPREIECLKWASEGKSGWEMSRIMDCSERTIIFHMNNAGEKLNANNRTQAIAKAIWLGYFSPSLDY